MVKLYELTYLISSELSENEAKEYQAKITSLIQEKEGVLVEENPLLKKRLAYPIKEQWQAYLATVNFKLLPKQLSDLEKNLKSESQILRYLLLSKAKPKAVKVARRAPGPVKKTIKPKIKLKEIEKKLEEILKE